MSERNGMILAIAILIISPFIVAIAVDKGEGVRSVYGEGK